MTCSTEGVVGPRGQGRDEGAHRGRRVMSHEALRMPRGANAQVLLVR